MRRQGSAISRQSLDNRALITASLPLASLLAHASLAQAQPEATHAVSEAKTKSSGSASTSSSPGGGMLQSLALPALMIGMIYFLIWRPQQKRQKEHDSLLKSLQRGNIVRTSGGIRGEVVEINEKDVQLMIADRVKINVLRSHIAGVETPQQQ